MKFDEFVLSFAEPPVRGAVVEMERRWCTCHGRQVWVPKNEPWPYFCSDNPKMLLEEWPSGDGTRL